MTGDFWLDVEDALSAWGDGMRTSNAALIASVYEDQAMSLQPGRPVHVGIDAVRGFWQAEMDRGGPSVRDSQTERLFADERDGLGVEVSTYVFSVVDPVSGERREEHGKYIGVYRRQPDGSVMCVAECLNDDGPT